MFRKSSLLMQKKFDIITKQRSQITNIKSKLQRDPNIYREYDRRK